MVMFKAKFRPMVAPKPQLLEKPRAAARPKSQQQQQQQQQRQHPGAPPIEQERGPRAPVSEPEPRHDPERAH